MEKELKKFWELSKQYKKDYEPDVDAGFSKFKQKLTADKNQKAEPIIISLKKRRRNWFAIAASIALIFAVGWIGLTLNNTSEKLLVESTTAKRLKEVRLADGTTVFLNEKSELRFPKGFRELATREVYLKGEAYFKVVENPNQPFIIHTAETQVEVLGTSFNLRAYEEESFTEIEVETGKVNFHTKNKSESLLLKASKKGVCVHGGKMSQKEAPNLLAQSWRTKVLKFRKTPIKEAITALERHYKVKIDIEKAGFKNCPITYSFIRQPLEDILEVIGAAFGSKMDGNMKDGFVFYGGSCSEG